MKRCLFRFSTGVALMFFLSSCYTYTVTVGKGPQSGVEVKKMNHYLLYGLAPVGISNPSQMAGDAKDYEVVIQHTFVDGLIAAITLGIYTPTTTIVKK
ncbi:MAG: Bor family protein [Chitinophagales bacterium]|nr:Bor family protein [Chitinophagales bacterium]MDW8427318.1 Bor family protein [Chitinophagales bacterium]